MIIQDNIEFHAGELVPVPGSAARSLLLSRVPAEIANKLNPRARHVVRDSVGTEIRFVTDAPTIKLWLSALKPEFGFEDLTLHVMCGDFDFNYFRIQPGMTECLTLTPPPQIARMKPEVLRRGPGIGFDPCVWRIIPERGGLIYQGIETFGSMLRPPKPEEKPAKLCLCYGSSITNSMALGYPGVLGRRLGLEIANVGLSGACLCEKEIADWLATGVFWDILTLELGINALGMNPEKFRIKADYLIQEALGHNPGKKIFLLSMFPSICRSTLLTKGDGDPNEEIFMKIIRDLADKYRPGGNVFLFEGKDILDEYGCLSCDFLHPRNYGHAVMGMNLARLMKPFL